MSEFPFSSSKEYTPYFRAFAHVKGLKDGDHWKAYEYMHWITGMHNAFRKLHGLGECVVQYGDLQKEFEEDFLYNAEVAK